MKQINKKEIKMESGSVYIEFIFVLPILFVITLWSTELINQIRYFNSAITLSKTAAEYVSRDCSSEVAIRTTDCIEYIPRELNTMAQSISAGSHVAIRVFYNIDPNNPSSYEVFDISNEYLDPTNKNIKFDYPPTGDAAGFHCDTLGNEINLPSKLNIRGLSSFVVAESYVYYKPIVPYIPLFWLSQEDYEVGEGAEDIYICDHTIL